MNVTQYTVYWLENSEPHCAQTIEMKLALGWMADLRARAECSAIVLCSENIDQVGKMGVDSVENGILPDGLDYVYKTGRDRGR